MEIKTVDARGLSCPQPIVETKKVLDKLSGGRVEVLVDTVTSRENVLRFGRNAGWQGSFEELDASFKVILEKQKINDLFHCTEEVRSFNPEREVLQNLINY